MFGSAIDKLLAAPVLDSYQHYYGTVQGEAYDELLVAVATPGATQVEHVIRWNDRLKIGGNRVDTVGVCGPIRMYRGPGGEDDAPVKMPGQNTAMTSWHVSLPIGSGKTTLGTMEAQGDCLGNIQRLQTVRSLVSESEEAAFYRGSDQVVGMVGNPPVQGMSVEWSVTNVGGVQTVGENGHFQSPDIDLEMAISFTLPPCTSAASNFHASPAPGECMSVSNNAPSAQSTDPEGVSAKATIGDCINIYVFGKAGNTCPVSSGPPPKNAEVKITHGDWVCWRQDSESQESCTYYPPDPEFEPTAPTLPEDGSDPGGGGGACPASLCQDGESPSASPTPLGTVSPTPLPTATPSCALVQASSLPQCKSLDRQVLCSAIGIGAGIFGSTILTTVTGAPAAVCGGLTAGMCAAFVMYGIVQFGEGVKWAVNGACQAALTPSICDSKGLVLACFGNHDAAAAKH